jgi:predicted nuclease of predicted toxin-antitoxin system
MRKNHDRPLNNCQERGIRIMIANDQGIELRYEELAALLAFAGAKNSKGIAFETTDTNMTAYAATGTEAVLVTADNDGLHCSQWVVNPNWLKLRLKGLSSGESLRLCFCGESLTEAVHLVPDENGDLVDGDTITASSDAVEHQLQFPFDYLRGQMRLPVNDVGVPISVGPKFLKRLLAVVNAAGIMSFRPPRKAHDPAMFVSDESKNEWRVISAPFKNDVKCAEECIVETHELSYDFYMGIENETVDKSKPAKRKTRKGVLTPDEVTERLGDD